MTVRFVLMSLCAAALLGGCATTRFYDRELLSDRAMAFDQDRPVVYMRDKIEAARLGSFGGFGDSTAGGCGCE